MAIEQVSSLLIEANEFFHFFGQLKLCRAATFDRRYRSLTGLLLSRYLRGWEGVQTNENALATGCVHLVNEDAG